MEEALRRMYNAETASKNVSSRQDADRTFRSSEYEVALRKYKDIAAGLLGRDFVSNEMPRYAQRGNVVGYRCEKYVDMEIEERIEVAKCCVAVAECLLKLDKSVEAMDWLNEVQLLHENFKYSHKPPFFNWKDLNPTQLSHFHNLVVMHAIASTLFRKLGNTSAAVWHGWEATKTIESPVMLVDCKPLQLFFDLHIGMNMRTLSQFRHPDPVMTRTLQVTEPALQVLGSWEKIDLPRSSKIPTRNQLASFMWHGRIYVFGGEEDLSGPYLRDLWYLDTNTFAGWRQLSSLPAHIRGEFTGHSVAAYKDRAYVFTGTPRIPYFDLTAETWSHVDVDRRNGPGYPFAPLQDFAVQVVHGKMYVFGGAHSASSLGSDLLMALDLETFVWEHLSGSKTLIATFDGPGPRRHPCMWADKNGERLFMMYGEANRMGASINGEPHGAMHGYAYDDMWSWDIKARKWRKEVVRGNAPCPRSEMGLVHNTVLNSTIAFGGYSPTLPTYYADTSEEFRFTYFADTFLLPAPTPACLAPQWKQVLTRGFPTYRAQARLLSDAVSGRVFLVGGYTNSEYVPARGKDHFARVYTDVWELRIDIEGGHFEGVDVEEEARTAQVGPFQRCFTCGSAGRWKKCGGSCKGRAFFCDQQCQKEGWREHKKRHKCAKR